MCKALHFVRPLVRLWSDPEQWSFKEDSVPGSSISRIRTQTDSVL
jgi:hypothetical protein